MKKIKIVLFLFLLLLTGKDVYAKDIVHSIHQYKNESLTEIKESYDKDGNHDGFVVAGIVLKDTIEYKDSTFHDNQILFMKYQENGKVVWSTLYGKTRDDRIIDLEYTYQDQKIDGYLLVVEKTYDFEEEGNNQITFLKYDLDGKLVWEKDSSEEMITKIISLEEGGYIASFNQGLVLYDVDMSVVWKRDYYETVIDFIPVLIQQERKHVLLVKDLGEKIHLVMVDKEGGHREVIEESMTEVPYVQLQSLEDGFILYGITSMVKLKNGDTSYFLKKYNQEKEEEWEVVGKDPVSTKEKILLQPVEDGYFLEYKNDNDNTYDIVKLNEEGLLEKKVKKLHNNYYHFEDFICYEDVFYFIGQMNCPDDDNCDYTHNSLFLRSDEDKVIEVKAEDNRVIIMISIGLLLLVFIVFLRRKKKR